jgi:hypothetical protein
VVEEISSAGGLFSMELVSYVFLPHIPIASVFDTKIFVLHLRMFVCWNLLLFLKFNCYLIIFP